MISRLNQAIDRLAGPRLRRAAPVGAWLFIIASLAQLLTATVKMGNPGEVTRLFGDGAWGLTYTGTGGLVQAIVQLALVTGAAIVTLPPLRRSDRLRRAGLAALTVWSAWWALNLAWQFTADGHAWSLMLASLFGALLGCTGYRTWRLWSIRPAGTARPEPAEVAELRPEHVSGSARVVELPAPSPAGRRRAVEAAAAAVGSVRRLASGLRPRATAAMKRLRTAAARLRERSAPAAAADRSAV